jgi:adenosylcobinamide-phosphate synthase
VNRPALLTLAYTTDRIAGDPDWFPHPVRIIGKAIATGEGLLCDEHHTAAQQLTTGTLLTLGIVLTTYYATAKTIDKAQKQSPLAGNAVELLLAWTCLATKSLEDEALTVTKALALHDLLYARTRLARIVGRDTATLDEQEISRAVIETVAESASDGILAPMFYMALGGVPLAMAYKAVNTLDSMIGHNDDRYRYFGKTAARLDDLANFIPARLTALAIATVSPNPKNSIAIWNRDGYKHKSPNAGQPEAAMAGAIAARLGGTNTYAGEPIQAPTMGAEFPPPTRAKAEQAIRLVTKASLLGLAAAILIAACIPESK